MRAEDRRLAAARRTEDREHVARLAGELDVERNRAALAQPDRQPAISHGAVRPAATARVVVISVATEIDEQRRGHDAGSCDRRTPACDRRSRRSACASRPEGCRRPSGRRRTRRACARRSGSPRSECSATRAAARCARKRCHGVRPQHAAASRTSAGWLRSRAESAGRRTECWRWPTRASSPSNENGSDWPTIAWNAWPSGERAPNVTSR